MAPEQEAQERAFYDHESDEPRRRRRAAADWGVNEDIFDRMPSRFSRVERRRAEHHDIVIRSEGGAATAEREPAQARDEGRRFARSETGEWTQVEAGERGGEAGRGERAAARRESGEWARVEAGERGDARRGEAARGESSRRESGERPALRVDVERPAVAARGDHELDPRAAARAVMSWGEDLDDAPLVPGESRTIVLSRDEDEPVDEAPRRQTGEFASLPAEPRERKTVVINGRPDRLPVPRTPRRPRTAVERIGHRPDRIVAYAVAMGFLLVLIAVLTTGQ